MSGPTDPTPGTRPRTRWEGLTTLAVLALGLAFFVWTSLTGDPSSQRAMTDVDLYNRLTEAFLAGQTFFVEPPAPELARLADPYDLEQNKPYHRFHDVSYFRGRYYLYFGPTPVLTLLLPWRVVTGSWLPPNLAVVAFAWATAAASVWFVRDIRRRYFGATPGWLMVALTALITFGSFLPLLVRRPLFYELAIISSAFFSVVGLGCVWRAWHASRAAWRWWAAAGLSFGLVLGARPNAVFGVAAVVALAAILPWWRERPNGDGTFARRHAGAMLALALPVFFCGVGLLAYNWARFGHALDFGTSYMFTNVGQKGLGIFTLRYFPVNAYYYLFAPPHPSLYFPFVTVTPDPPFSVWGHTGSENIYGLVPTVPAALALLWLPLARRRGKALPAPVVGLACVVLGLVLPTLGGLLLLDGANVRYVIDYLPPTMILVATGVLVGTGWADRGQGIRRVAVATAMAAGVVFHVLASFQHKDLWRTHAPESYVPIARAANHWSAWSGGLAGRNGALRLELVFPAGRSEGIEPIAVAGIAERADYIYVEYLPGDKVRFGYDHNRYGGGRGRAIGIDPTRTHTLEVWMGALYPPVEHPAYDGLSAEQVAARKRRIEVRLDGEVVLSGRGVGFDASPGDLSIGRNRLNPTWGRRFTGEIRSVTRFDALP